MENRPADKKSPKIERLARVRIAKVIHFFWNAPRSRAPPPLIGTPRGL
jgi:hypothetical protein